MKTPLLGPAYTAQSKNLADSQCINLYPEVAENKQGREVGAFFPCPGRTLLATCGSGPVRGACVMGGNLYVVSGFNIYQVTPLYVVALAGTIGTGTGPVSMIANATQLMIADGVSGYLVMVTGGLIIASTIALPFAGPVMLAYQDGFGLAYQANSNTWWQSNLLDLSTWNALNFQSTISTPANLVALVDVDRYVWLLAADHAEVWINAGTVGFAFAILNGAYISQGCAAPFSAVRCGETLLWLSQSTQGQGMVMQAKSINGADRVSTHALEQEFAGYSTIADAIGFCYQENGHVFYVLTFPTANRSWCLDLTATAQMGIPMWHRRAAFINGMLNRLWDNCYVAFNGQNIVGDYLTGNLYSLDLANETDNGQPRKWVRSWRAMQQSTIAPTRFSALQIEMETGAGVASGFSPNLVLRYSDDGAHTWSAEMFRAAGPEGATSQRVKFNRLGSTRRASGLDRIFELSSTDAFKVALLGAELVE